MCGTYEFILRCTRFSLRLAHVKLFYIYFMCACVNVRYTLKNAQIFFDLSIVLFCIGYLSLYGVDFYVQLVFQLFRRPQVFYIVIKEHNCIISPFRQFLYR